MITEESCDWEEEDDGMRSEVSAKRDSINLNSLDCWDYSIELECLKGPEDLQLAAELGKTLLERNKELENSLKQCQNIIDEQTQEIEYLTKQTTALRKTNDNRIRIYEQLEVSIQELERANQRLALDNATDKKQIKSLCAYRDTLEARCEELQKAVDEARLQQTIQKEKLRKLNSTKEEVLPESPELPKPKPKPQAKKETNVQPPTTTEHANNIPPDQEDLVNQLLIQIQELKSHRSRDQRKITDLEEEICRRTQDMALLEEELSALYQREEHVKNLQEEISALEEVRSGHLCGRCLKEIDSKLPQEVQMLLDPEEESTVNDKFYNDIHLEIKEENPYRTLVEKYEAIMEEQSKNRRHSRDFSKSNSSNCLSLQDELKMYGELNSFNKDPEEEDESGREDNEETQIKTQRTENKRKLGKRKMFSTTPTDFSEAETSSSGFSDETSNKSTQTERNLVPGSFLCSIADGDDCKFSIYDDACPIESRFRKTPEYRTLFKEIFDVLKRAAEAKEEGDKLPLLDDMTPLVEVPKVPPVTPAKEDVPDFEDLQSLPESLNMSEAASETSSILDPNMDQTFRVDVTQGGSNENQEPTAGPSDTKKEGKKQTNDILEYLSIGIGVKKKNKKRYANSPARKLKVSEIVEKIEGSAPNSPRRSARRRKEWKNYDSPRAGNSRNQSPAVQPRVLTTLEREKSSPSSSSVWGTQTFLSKAAQEVAQLKKLEKSYAEVLRHTPKSYISKRKSVTSPIV